MIDRLFVFLGRCLLGVGLCTFTILSMGNLLCICDSGAGGYLFLSLAPHTPTPVAIVLGLVGLIVHFTVVLIYGALFVLLPGYFGIGCLRWAWTGQAPTLRALLELIADRVHQNQSSPRTQ